MDPIFRQVDRPGKQKTPVLGRIAYPLFNAGKKYQKRLCKRPVQNECHVKMAFSKLQREFQLTDGTLMHRCFVINYDLIDAWAALQNIYTSRMQKAWYAAIRISIADSFYERCGEYDIPQPVNINYEYLFKADYYEQAGIVNLKYRF